MTDQNEPRVTVETLRQHLKPLGMPDDRTDEGLSEWFASEAGYRMETLTEDTDVSLRVAGDEVEIYPLINGFVDRATWIEALHPQNLTEQLCQHISSCCDFNDADGLAAFDNAWAKMRAEVEKYRLSAWEWMKRSETEQ